MTPKQTYHNAIQNLGFTADPVQAEAVQLTQKLYLELLNRHFVKPSQNISAWEKLWQYLSSLHPWYKPSPPVTGLYFWGGVGRGKTWLIDSFFHTLPFPEKRRVHFHHFMNEVHEQLKSLPKTPDPLPIIAQQIAQQYRLLCIDEFHVQDITDAMLLAGLLEALFTYGITLVTTSNIAPDELYKNGLQRDHFLPAIKWIKKNTQVFELNNKTDYRHQTLMQKGCYHSPLNKYNTNLLREHFIDLSNHAPIEQQNININNRPIPVLALNHSSEQYPQTVIWFEFDELCNTPRSNSDYLLIAEQYANILITGIYRMDEQKDDIAKRFVHLIDALYDRHCHMIITAETEPDDLYQGRLLQQPFQRTASRLIEMRSKKW